MLAITYSWKDATETNNFCLESKLTTNNCGKNTTKTPSRILSNMTYFVAAQSNYKS